MKSRVSHLAILYAAAVTIFGGLAIQAQTPSAGTTTLTGVVSDAMCGKHHTMQGISDAQCTRLCVKAGSAYALVVGDKVYTLHGDSPDLDKYAGEKVTLKGRVNGTNVRVQSVTPAT